MHDQAEQQWTWRDDYTQEEMHRVIKFNPWDSVHFDEATYENMTEDELCDALKIVLGQLLFSKIGTEAPESPRNQSDFREIDNMTEVADYLKVRLGYNPFLIVEEDQDREYELWRSKNWQGLYERKVLSDENLQLFLEIEASRRDKLPWGEVLDRMARLTVDCRKVGDYEDWESMHKEIDNLGEARYDYTPTREIDFTAAELVKVHDRLSELNEKVCFCPRPDKSIPANATVEWLQRHRMALKQYAEELHEWNRTKWGREE